MRYYGTEPPWTKGMFAALRPYLAEPKVEQYQGGETLELSEHTPLG